MNFGGGQILDPTLGLQRTLSGLQNVVGTNIEQDIKRKKLEQDAIDTAARLNIQRQGLGLREAAETRMATTFGQEQEDRRIQQLISGANVNVGLTEQGSINVALSPEAYKANVGEAASTAQDTFYSDADTSQYQEDQRSIDVLKSQLPGATPPVDFKGTYQKDIQDIDAAFDAGTLTVKERRMARNNARLTRDRTERSQPGYSIQDKLKTLLGGTFPGTDARALEDSRKRIEDKATKGLTDSITTLEAKQESFVKTLEENALSTMQEAAAGVSTTKVTKGTITKSRSRYSADLKAAYTKEFKGQPMTTALKAGIGKAIKDDMKVFDSKADDLYKAAQEMRVFKAKETFKGKTKLAARVTAKSLGLTGDDIKGYSTDSRALENAYKAEKASMDSRHEEDYMFDSTRQDERDALNEKFNKLRNKLKIEYKPL